MGLFSSRHRIKCPECREVTLFNREEQEKGELKLLGKDIEGYIHIEHKCGAHLRWDTLKNRVEKIDDQSI